MSMKFDMTPCLDCNDRVSATNYNCHDHCERYLKFRKELNDYKDLQYETNKKERLMDGYEIERTRIIKKSKH